MLRGKNAYNFLRTLDYCYGCSFWYNQGMYTQILAHKKYMRLRMSGKKLKTADREALYRYHLERVKDFQHERLIHLIVTLFFAVLFIVSMIAWLIAPTFIPGLRWPLGIQTLILFILDVFYVAHYYHLENGVQSLYEITEKFRV